MWSREEKLKMEKYSDRILEIIDRVDELTRSDLQGMVGALVITMVLDMKKEFQEYRLKEKLEGKSEEDLQKELDELIEHVGEVKALERVAAHVDYEYQDGAIWTAADKETIERWIREIEKRVYDR